MFTHENPWQLQNTNFRTDLEARIYPQELSNHTIILFCNISERFNYFSPRILQHWLPSVNNASRYTDGSFFYKYWLFIKLQKMEGEVFIALGTSHGDFEPPRAIISPQSPPSLKPAKYLGILWCSDFSVYVKSEISIKPKTKHVQVHVFYAIV